MISLTPAAIYPTVIQLGVVGAEADGQTEIQLSSRDDFQFCVSPIYSVDHASNLVTISGLNQRAQYFARGRARRTSGAVSAWGPTLPVFTSPGAAQNLTVPAVLVWPAMLVMAEPVFDISAFFTRAGYPADNMLIDSPVAWEAGNDGASNYIFQFRTSGRPIDTLALLQTNFPEDATVTITMGVTAAALDNANAPVIYSGPFRASANLPGRPGYHGLFRFALNQYLWLRVFITSPSQPFGLAHVEHLVVGWNRTSKNRADDSSEQPSQLGTVERVRSGAVDRVLGHPMRRVELDLANLSEVQYETIYADLMQQQGQRALLLPNSRPGPFLHDRLLYGALSGGKKAIPRSKVVTLSLAIDSVI